MVPSEQFMDCRAHERRSHATWIVQRWKMFIGHERGNQNDDITFSQNIMNNQLKWCVSVWESMSRFLSFIRCICDCWIEFIYIGFCVKLFCYTVGSFHSLCLPFICPFEWFRFQNACVGFFKCFSVKHWKSKCNTTTVTCTSGKTKHDTHWMWCGIPNFKI